MKKQYYISMNHDGKGGKYHSELGVTVFAENEFNARKEAEKRHPNLVVAWIEEKK